MGKDKDIKSLKIDIPLDEGVIIGVCIKTEERDGGTALTTCAVSNFEDGERLKLDPVALFVMKVFMKALGEAGERLNKLEDMLTILEGLKKATKDSEDSEESEESMEENA